MPSIDRYMTREPYCLDKSESLERARHLMAIHEVRHLPVIDNQQLVGLISDREVTAFQSVPGLDLERVDVARVMTKPTVVWAGTLLDDVAERMTREKIDCVVVRGGRGVEGVFTTIDAITALKTLLARAKAVRARFAG